MTQVKKLFSQLAQSGLILIWSGQRGKALSSCYIQTNLDSNSLLTPVHYSDEIQSAFRVGSDPIYQPWRSLPDLKLEDRIRRAVLEPLLPLNYTLAGAGGNELS